MTRTIPPHLALGCLSREIVEILMVESRRLDLDAVDILLITCVAYLSTAHALSDPMSIQEYDGGYRPLPIEHARPVIAKEVSITLNMNRETVRRRMSKLAERNFLIKDGRYFLFPYQGGETDFTENTRNLASRSVLRMANLLNL